MRRNTSKRARTAGGYRLPGLLLAVCLGGAATLEPSNWRDEPIAPIPRPPTVNPFRFELGKALYNDTRLSSDGVTSCASCHDLGSNGAMTLSQARRSGGAPVGFDTQTVFNAALNYRYNWEGDARTLEAQATIAIESPELMATTVSQSVLRLSNDASMQRAFESAYGHGPDGPALLDAIATFERTLLTPDSRFDLWLRGDDNALSANELYGYRTFKAVGCISCHQGVNVGGNLMQPHGIFRAFGGPAPHLLRVPSLRNIAMTAPYFHDGSAATLPVAVRTMASAQLGRELSSQQVDAIVAFLGTLTGRYEGVLVTVPR